eukprot:119924_1
MSIGKPLLQLLRTPRQLDVLKQLQIEEYLFKTTQSSFCVLNHGCPSPAIVMGSYNDPKLLLNIDNILKDNIPVIRRFSGGGTVFIDENSYFMSIITNAKEIGLKEFEGKYIGPREIMQWTNNLLCPVFNDINNMEFSILEHVDYVLCNKNNKMIKKIAGNAQKISRDRFDHHTSFLWNYNIDLINKYLTIPPTKNQPKYRKNRSHKDFLICLDELFNYDINTFESKILNELHKQFEIKEISLDELFKIYHNLPSFSTDKETHLKTKIINDELEMLCNIP